MKIQDIKNLIFAELEPFATSNGFKIVKSRFALSRRIGNRSEEIWFTTNAWGFEVHLFPYVSVDFSDITAICNACGFHLNHSAFINLRLLQAIKSNGFNPDLRWQMQVKNTDRFVLTDNNFACNWLDLNNELLPILPLAVDFMSQYNSIAALDALYNTRPIELYCPYCSGLDTHCMVGLISAKLSRNSDYEDVKQMYQQIVKRENFTVEMKSSFTRLTAYLDNYEVDR